MARRKTKNTTGLKRIEGIDPFLAWVGYTCVRCGTLNHVQAGKTLLDPEDTYKNAEWKCQKCHFLHSSASDLPFAGWKASWRSASSVSCQRFWQGFFRIYTEAHDSYWKQCNTCGHILPANAFSRHADWGPLERQMECRSCKGVINAILNPKRTHEQLWEGSIKRRVGDLLLEGENHKADDKFIRDLFSRFGSRCFKTGKHLDISDRGSWAIDHILPSRYLYPLKKENAALLSREANGHKRDRWPSAFYTNSELIRLAQLTGANLDILASKKPIFNPSIDVDACVTRYLTVREKSDLPKRIKELKKLLEGNKLTANLSKENRRLLGYK